MSRGHLRRRGQQRRLVVVRVGRFIAEAQQRARRRGRCTGARAVASGAPGTRQRRTCRRPAQLDKRTPGAHPRGRDLLDEGGLQRRANLMWRLPLLADVGDALHWRLATARIMHLAAQIDARPLLGEVLGAASVAVGRAHDDYAVGSAAVASTRRSHTEGGTSLGTSASWRREMCRWSASSACARKVRRPFT